MINHGEIRMMQTARNAADARRDPRHVTVLMVGKVRGPRGECACVVSDVSQRGLRARFPYPPKVGERVTLSLRGEQERTATVRWVDGFRGGLEFDEAIDVTAVLVGSGEALPPRAPRFQCGEATTLMLGDERCPTELVDVSLGGAKLSVSEPLPPDAIGRWATLVLPGANVRRAGIICWARGNRIGLRFALSLSLEALAAVLARRRR